MKKLLLYLLLASCAFGQSQVLQEATAAQATAGTAGAGYYISPRRQGGGSGTPGTVTSVAITPTSTVTGTVANSTTAANLTLTAITNPSPSGNNLISGGNVDAIASSLSMTVGAATYVIQGVQYTSPAATLTASGADPSFDRIDIVALNSSGAAVLIEGTPGNPALAPDVDPTTQLQLTFYKLAAGSTALPVTIVNVYQENAGPPGEFTATKSGSPINLASTNNPYLGSVDIEGTSAVAGNSFTFTASADFDPGASSTFFFYVAPKAAWPNPKQFSVQLLNSSGTPIGSIVTFKNGTFNFNSGATANAYQQVGIATSLFGANGQNARAVRFTVAGGGAAIGFYFDDFTLQNGLAPVADNSKMAWKGNYAAATFYNVNDVVLSSGIQYVAIAAGSGNTPASSATFWQPSTANSGGSVTSVSVTTANGVSGSVATATSTPAITLALGDITPTSVTTTGIDSSAGAAIEVANALGALAIDVTKGLNTKTISADSTFTFSGTPANSNQGFSLRLTNSDTANHIITIPSTFDTNAQATTTSFTILAGGIETITWVYNGSTYLGYNIPSPAYSSEITVASATTTAIGAAASVNVAISGTTPITGFGTVAAGTFRQGRFTGILTFTHNGTSLILPNAGSNITTAANDRFGAYSLGSGNWLVLWYQRADGTALAGSGGFSSTTTATTLQNAQLVTLSSSSTDTFVGTAGVTATSYSTGTHYTFTANTANTGAASLNINTLGAKTIVKVQGGITTTLADNDIRSGQVCDLVYDGTNFQLQSTLGNAPTASAPGSDTQVVYNSSGSLAATSALTHPAAGLVVTAPSGQTSIDLATQTAQSGALRFFPNAGVTSNPYLAGVGAAAGAGVPDSAVGDLVIVANNKRILFSTDGGTVGLNMPSGTAGLTWGTSAGPLPILCSTTVTAASGQTSFDLKAVSAATASLRFFPNAVGSTSAFIFAAGAPGAGGVTDTATGDLNIVTSNHNINFSTDGGTIAGQFVSLTGKFTVSLGVTPNGGGLKHARVTTGSINAATSALVTITWGTAFADANYTVNASVLDSTTSNLALQVVHVESVAAGSVTVRVYNSSAGSLTGTVQVIAMHD